MPNAMGEKLIDERVTLRRHFLDHARQEGEKSKPNLAILALGHVVGRHCQDAKSNWIRLFDGDVEEQKSTGLLDEPWKRELVMHRVAPARNDISHTVFFTFLPQLCGGSKVAGKKHKVKRKQTAYDGTWELKSKKKELTTKYLTGQTLKFTEDGKISMSMLEVTLKTDIKPQKVSLCLVYKGHIDAATAYLMETIAQGVPQVIPLGEDKGMLLSERNNKLPVKITSTGPKRELEESSNQPENNKKLCLFRRFPENLETGNSTGSGSVDYASAANICNEIENFLHTENDIPNEQFGSLEEVYSEFLELTQPTTGVSHQADEPDNEVVQPFFMNDGDASMQNQLPQLSPHPATEVATSPSIGFPDSDAVAQKHIKTGPTPTPVGYPQSGAPTNQAARGNEQQQQDAPSENLVGNEIFTSTQDPLDEVVQPFLPLHLQYPTIVATSPSNGFHDNDAVARKGVLISTNQYDSSVESQFQQDLQAIGGNTSHTVPGQANLQPVPEPENDPELIATMIAELATDMHIPTQDQVPLFPPVEINEDPTTVLANSPSNGFPDNDAVPQKPPFPQDMRADEFATYEFPDEDYSLMQNQKDQSIWIRDGAGSGNNDKFEDLNDNDLKHFS